MIRLMTWTVFYMMSCIVHNHINWGCIVIKRFSTRPFSGFLRTFFLPGNASARYVLILYLHFYISLCSFIHLVDHCMGWGYSTWQYVHVSYCERLSMSMLSEQSLMVIFVCMLVAQVVYHRIYLIRNELQSILHYLTSSLEI